MEAAAARNGFDDISVALYVSVASGDRAGTVTVSYTHLTLPTILLV